jgi:DNA mismatch endonuclease (patch repair protein)
MERDLEVTAHLESEGWMVIRFWGNEIKKNTVGCADIIEKVLEERND